MSSGILEAHRHLICMRGIQRRDLESSKLFAQRHMSDGLLVVLVRDTMGNYNVGPAFVKFIEVTHDETSVNNCT